MILGHWPSMAAPACTSLKQLSKLLGYFGICFLSRDHHLCIFPISPMEGLISVRASGPILYTLTASLNSATFVIQFDPPWRLAPFLFSLHSLTSQSLLYPFCSPFSCFGSYSESAACFVESLTSLLRRYVDMKHIAHFFVIQLQSHFLRRQINSVR